MRKLVFIMPLMAISLLASCGTDNREQYVVYFDTNGGSSEVYRQIVKEGDYAKDPEIDVKRNGISMSYWSLQDEDDTNPSKFTFKDNKITSDTTLHAIYPPDMAGPLTITCTKGPMNLSMYWTGNLFGTNFNVKWSKDKENWQEVNVHLQGLNVTSKKIEEINIPLNVNESVYLVGTNPDGVAFAGEKGDRFIAVTNDIDDEESEFKVSGNPLSLVDETNYNKISKIPVDYCFDCLFDKSNVVSAKELSLTCDELSYGCYCGMFHGCKKLKETPNLPSVKLADHCYFQMFDGCTNLESVPSILPATELKQECYSLMFSGCEILTEAPELPASSFNDSCNDCYERMFAGCENLSHIKVGFGENDVWPDSGDNDFTASWLDSVSDSGIFEWKGTDNPVFTRDENTVPADWTIQHY